MSARLTAYVVTPDIERMKRFYEGGLGVRGAPQQGNWLPLSLGGGTFALHAMGADGDPQQIALSFAVDDIEATVARFQEQGAKVLRGIADETFGRMATLQDPDGRTFEVVQHS